VGGDWRTHSVSGFRSLGPIPVRPRPHSRRLWVRPKASVQTCPARDAPNADHGLQHAPVAGGQIATTTSSWNSSSSTQVPHPVSIYFASVPLEPGKTIASVTLPTVSTGVGNGVNAMHIFAIAIGSGTPTSGGSASPTNRQFRPNARSARVRSR